MAEQGIQPIIPTTLQHEVRTALDQFDPAEPRALLHQPAAGITEFTADVFADVEPSQLFAKKQFRNGSERGPHFDIYGHIVDPDAPIVGVYNLTGRATLRAVALSDELQEHYENHYPKPNDAAYKARRELSRIALEEAAIVYEGAIEPGTGMILPQHPKANHLVHEITPRRRIQTHPFLTPSAPDGSFVKFIVPASAAVDAIREQGFVPLPQFIEEQLSGQPIEERQEGFEDFWTPKSTPTAARSVYPEDSTSVLDAIRDTTRSAVDAIRVRRKPHRTSHEYDRLD